LRCDSVEVAVVDIGSLIRKEISEAVVPPFYIDLLYVIEEVGKVGA
jgi:hypothetical protein